MNKNNTPFVVLSILALWTSTAPANAQRSYQQMEQMLSQIDSTPPPRAQRAQQTQSARAYWQAAPNQNQRTLAHSPNSGQMQPRQGIQNFQPVQQQTAANPLGQLMQMFGGGGQQAQAPAQQRSGGFNPLKIMFGGDSGGGNASGNAGRARTQASVAHNAYLRSCYGDHDSRSSAADEAYYAAEEARHEADNADSKAQSGDSNAQSYAYAARAAAEDAQADADRARSNADSY